MSPTLALNTYRSYFSFFKLFFFQLEHHPYIPHVYIPKFFFSFSTPLGGSPSNVSSPCCSSAATLVFRSSTVGLAGLRRLGKNNNGMEKMMVITCRISRPSHHAPSHMGSLGCRSVAAKCICKCYCKIANHGFG